MYGLIAQMKATPENRDALIAILAAATGNMPGNLAYVIAEDKADGDALWVTEIWDSQKATPHHWVCPLSGRQWPRAAPWLPVWIIVSKRYRLQTSTAPEQNCLPYLHGCWHRLHS